jgi:hypothetical protein
MISLGIIGTYIAQIYQEVKYRPRYVVAETLTSRGNEELPPSHKTVPTESTPTVASESSV